MQFRSTHKPQKHKKNPKNHFQKYCAFIATYCKTQNAMRNTRKTPQKHKRRHENHFRFFIAQKFQKDICNNATLNATKKSKKIKTQSAKPNHQNKDSAIVFASVGVCLFSSLFLFIIILYIILYYYIELFHHLFLIRDIPLF